MKPVFINGWKIDVKGSLTDYQKENLSILMSNHLYNLNTDWERIRVRKQRV